MNSIYDYIKSNPPLSKSDADYWNRMARELNCSVDRVRSRVRRAFLKEFKLQANIHTLYDAFREEVIDQPGEQPASERKEWTETQDKAIFDYTGTEVIDTLPKALAKSQVDLKKWRVAKQRFSTNTVTMKLRRQVGKNEDGKPVYEDQPSQHTNYVCRLEFERIDVDQWEAIDLLSRKIADYEPKGLLAHQREGSGVGVFALADFHFGANVKKLLTTPDFNINIILERFERIVSRINRFGYEEVHFLMCGDFIESFTGLNHLSTFRELETYGWGAIQLAHETMMQHLFSKVHNVKSISLVNGNHDRMTSSSKEDVIGEAANAIAYLLRKEGLEVHHDPVVLKRVIDGVCYIVTHGHLGIAKNITSLLFEHGEQGLYNVIVKGHLHSRQNKKAIRVFEEDVVEFDSAKYRVVTVPPLFTGNFFSASLGYSSTAGLTQFENNGYGLVNHGDFAL